MRINVTPGHKIQRLIKERDNCPVCNSDKYKVVYKGKRKHPKARYFKRLECLVCGYRYIAESNKEFKSFSKKSHLSQSVYGMNCVQI
jgi:rubredoxin